MTYQFKCVIENGKHKIRMGGCVCVYGVAWVLHYVRTYGITKITLIRLSNLMHDKFYESVLKVAH